MKGDSITEAELLALVSRARDRLTEQVIEIAALPDPAAAMDFDGNGKIVLEEAVAFALSQDDWEKFRPVLKALRLQHPLDTTKFPPALRTRIATIAREIEAKTGKRPGDPGYCEAFVPAFVEAGKPSFRKGGLCFGYTEKRTVSIEKEPEMTAAESFDLCLHPKRGVYGSCTEKTYVVIGALKAAGIDCDVHAQLTENHVYPAMDERSLDPSEIGETGWSFETQPAAMYLDSLAGKDQRARIVDVAAVAKLMEPHAYMNWGRIKERLQQLQMLYRRKELLANAAALRAAKGDAMKLLKGEEREKVLKLLETDPSEQIPETIAAILDEFDAVVIANPKTIIPWLILARNLSAVPKQGQIDVAFTTLASYPQNPYVLLPLSIIVASDQNILLAQQGNAEAAKSFEEDVRTLASWLEGNFPFSGFAETVRAAAAGYLGRTDEQERLALRAIANNPHNAIALQMLASHDLSNGRFEAAEGIIREAIAAAPNMTGNHYMLAQAAQLRNDFNTAEAEARKEATIFYGNAMAAWLAVSLSILRGQPRRAMQILNWRGNGDAAKLPTSFRASLAQAFELMGNIREARRLTMRELELSPINPQAHGMLAMLALEESDVAAARKHLAHVTGPTSALFRAMIELQLSYVENDVATFKREFEALKRTPGVDPTLIARYDVALDQIEGRLEAARTKAGMMASRNVSDYASRAQVIWLDIAFGRLASAAKAFDAFVKEFPDLSATKALRATLRLRQGRPADALAAADTALAVNPRSYEALMTKGAALLMLGRAPGALKIGQRMDALLPKHTSGKLLMARAHLVLGRPEKAREFLPQIKAVETFDLKEWPLWSSSALERDIAAALAKKR
jgi:Flp pilus assembly protein TadD